MLNEESTEPNFTETKSLCVSIQSTKEIHSQQICCSTGREGSEDSLNLTLFFYHLRLNYKEKYYYYINYNECITIF